MWRRRGSPSWAPKGDGHGTPAPTGVSNFSTYLANDIINTRLRGTATPHVTVSTTAVAKAGTGGGTLSPTVSAVFVVAAGGVTSNSGDVEFTSVAAGTYGFVQVWTDGGRTNLLYTGALAAAKTADAGDTLRFAAGELTVTNT
jgi:hypothetical protein